MPTISVIVPAFNAAATLGAALDSARRQTFRDIELVVVDDGSSDSTAEVARAWMAANPVPSRLLQPGRNTGPAGARNAGIRAASGEWIAFLDADDVWYPWRLTCQWDVVSADATVAAVCARTRSLVCGKRSGRSPTLQHRKKNLFFDNGGTTSRLRLAATPRHAVSSGEKTGFPQQQPNADPAPVPAAPTDPPSFRALQLEEFIEGNPVATSTVLVTKQALLDVGGFDERFRGPEDLDLWMRLVAAHRMLKLDVAVANYTERVGSLCLDPDRFLPQVLQVYEKAFGDEGVLRKWRHRKAGALSARYVSGAWTYALAGRRDQALRAMLTSWRLHPGRLTVERRQPLWRASLFFRILFGQVL